MSLPNSLRNGQHLPKFSDRIGTFQLSSIGPSDAAFTPLLYRQREETFRNRTTQIRHGSYLRRFTKSSSLDIGNLLESSGINVDDYMHCNGLTGCIVVQEGAVRLEEYRHGNTPASRNDVQSITKSVVSTVLAIAHQEGKLAVEDTVGRHVEELRGTAWADVPLLALLSMSSGIVEPPGDSRPADIPNPMYATDLYPQTDPHAVLNWLKTFKKVAEPWEEFHYYNPNYYVLSTAISRAVGEPLEDYISHQIWDPAGMQYDAYIRTTAAGHADGHGGLSVTLADMARFGYFILDGFKTEGQGPPVPAGWFGDISQAKSSVGPRAAGAIDMAPNLGYEAGWWTPKRGEQDSRLEDNGVFAGIGMYGQAIFVIPKLQATVAIQSGYPEPSPDVDAQNMEFVAAVIKVLKQV
ncbi:hypothetical protein FZEAL_9177 [Fusarium zealandicum]|uniref:Beta-lactamase-related domain-containing protein n=1 Tax=Fusarium zealandicum TaxID=1053134 RepID=A0A8H4UCV4_9HYPO|nr:hypothetical protein FZEAL_9177 [Fusarium zealandicum]